MKELFGFLFMSLVGYSMGLCAGEYDEAKTTTRIPLAIRTGNAVDIHSLQERHALLLAEIKKLAPEKVLVKKQNAVRIKRQLMRHILPSFVHAIPESIPLFVDFDIADSPHVRAYKFVQMGLLVKDMTMDYAINKEILFTYDDPFTKSIPNSYVHFLVGKCFLEALSILSKTDLDSTSDTLINELLSQAHIATWAMYQLRLAGPGNQDLALIAAIKAHDLTEKSAQILQELPPHQESYRAMSEQIDRLKKETENIIEHPELAEYRAKLIELLMSH